MTARSIRPLAAAAFALTLMGCASGQVDRHGRPIEHFSKVSVDTSPDPGVKPTRDEVLEALQKTFSREGTTFKLRSMADTAWSYLETRYSGWLVCYEVTGKNVFGVAVTNSGGSVFARDKAGVLQFQSQLAQSASSKCR